MAACTKGAKFYRKTLFCANALQRFSRKSEEAGSFAFPNSIKNKIDGLSLSGPEAGFLAWVDCRETGLDTPGDFFINHAGVGVYDGSWFGREGYIRLNFGCPRSVLEESIERIQKAFSQRN